MIEGKLDERGVPVIGLRFAGRSWSATIDTGFNGYLELPEDLRGTIPAKFIGQSESQLAGGHIVTEDQYVVQFPFNGTIVRALATFSPGDGILIGTRLLMPYRLTVDFPDGKVWLEID